MKTLRQIINNRLTDKNERHSYLDSYEKLFKSIRFSAKNVMEIGFGRGGGILMLHDFFENASIYSVDIKLDRVSRAVDRVKDRNRIRLFEGDAYNIDFINNNLSDRKFDIIIDDGSHIAEDQQFFIDTYSSLINEGGL